MKALLNWRYYVIFVLFSIGIIALMASGGDPVEEMSLAKELFLHALYFGISMLSFYILKRVVDYWEARDLIPELTKLAEEDEWE